jgi:transcriptional regulator with XRE-family HTH domain
MDQSDNIGARLRILRRWRGMTQAQLAGLSGLNQPIISMIENGQRPLDRRSQIAALAAALRVSESDLAGGPHLSADRQQSDPHMGIPALRTALLTNSLARPATDRARPAAELAAEVKAIEALHQGCDYLAVGLRLPGVIDELHARVHAPADEAERKLALATLIDACQQAKGTASALGYTDLSHVAALRAEEAAQVLGDPAGKGKAAFLLVLSVPREPESWGRALVMAEQAAGALEPHARDTEAACVLGMLTLSAALAAAVLQRGPAADHWLSEADSLAARVPDDMPGNFMSFGTTNVAVWRTALAVERGESGGAMTELAGQITPDQLRATPSGRRAAFYADIGRGLARDPKTRPEAIQWLRKAENAAPQRIRNSAPARETVAFLLQRSRAEAGGRELRGMAARMGVLH